MLKRYIHVDRLSHVRPSSNPLFLSLKKPFVAIKACTTINILQEAIHLTPRCFRPTGAASNFQSGCDPDVVWSFDYILEEHYVHNVPPASFTFIE